jgi:ubiquinol-cytochrome c reductase cytochrome b subunit
MPWIGNWKLGHRFNVGFLGAIMAGAVLLTYLAKAQDNGDPSFRVAVEHAEKSADRARILARNGIPREGALALLQNDPMTKGPKLFALHCASCHRYDGHDGLGNVPADPQSAPEMKAFASREWLTEFLDPEHIVSSNYFGGTRFKEGKMVRFVQRTIGKFTPEQHERLKKVIAAVSAEAQLPGQAEMDKADAAAIEEGRKLVDSEEMRCTECHQFRKPDENATAPDLTGYGSVEWLTEFVKDPAHARFYARRNDRMPSYGKDGKLDEASIAILVQWLRNDAGP